LQSRARWKIQAVHAKQKQRLDLLQSNYQSFAHVLREISLLNNLQFVVAVLLFHILTIDAYLAVLTLRTSFSLSGLLFLFIARKQRDCLRRALSSPAPHCRVPLLEFGTGGLDELSHVLRERGALGQHHLVRQLGGGGTTLIVVRSLHMRSKWSRIWRWQQVLILLIRKRSGGCRLVRVLQRVRLRAS